MSVVKKPETLPPSTTRLIMPCPSEALPPFPDPVPRPSVVATVPRGLLFGSDRGPKSLGDVGRRLEAILVKAEFRQLSYLGYKCFGFAVIADLERIEPDGTPFAGERRFGSSEKVTQFSIADYVARLFYAPPGYYRQIVFLVTPEQKIEDTGTLPTEGELEAVLNEGLSALPAAYDDSEFTRRHRVLALIYEFEKAAGDTQARMIDPNGRLEATVHLGKANIYQSLRGRAAP